MHTFTAMFLYQGITLLSANEMMFILFALADNQVSNGLEMQETGVRDADDSIR